MSVARSRRPDSADLVDLICRAVAAGNGPLLDVLLVILDAVADTDMLDRLTAALTPQPPAGHAAPPGGCGPRTPPPAPPTSLPSDHRPASEE
ncbi:hypothetical protein [Kitasatospora sp. NPDC085464]|uniref:hypothetical protein n=1 Tax=Kitasatospora sp. NPDC085464 TaxID=3364063 RepID=UPI0037C99C88